MNNKLFLSMNNNQVVGTKICQIFFTFKQWRSVKVF